MIYANIRSIIHKNQKIETTQMFNRRWMHKMQYTHTM